MNIANEAHKATEIRIAVWVGLVLGVKCPSPP